MIRKRPPHSLSSVDKYAALLKFNGDAAPCGLIVVLLTGYSLPG